MKTQRTSLVSTDSRLAPLRGLLLYSRYHGLQLWLSGMQRVAVHVADYGGEFCLLTTDGPYPFRLVVSDDQLAAVPYSD